MSAIKCPACGSTNIDTDPARGDAVCKSCGNVVEDQLIVSETTFEETPSGHMVAYGQFVASDSTGGATGFGAAYHVNGKESRGITLQNARRGITQLCAQLHLQSYCVDIAMGFYKMALNYHLTRGRKQAHNQAACVYITCRTEKTAHMLIDISDVLQICVHELGRTYVKFAKALHINIPSIDPCLYIIRFANKLDFGDKHHEVSMTALRVVQRMKRDSIHSGRRPSGLCGAALLIAARLHEFNRTSADIIKIVKVHESTLRKRLIEFGDTPSSALTLDEFMTVDLEEEQDPPAFKAARKKDRERLQKLDNIDAEISELQAEIDRQLEEYKTGKLKKRKDTLGDMESEDTDKFIRESNLNVINEFVHNNVDDPDEIQDSTMEDNCSDITGLGPDLATMGLLSTNDSTNETKEKLNNNEDNCEEISIDDIDDEELDSYILSEKEANYKSALWNKVNAEYLVKEKEKEEKRLKETEEGKPEKKRRRTTKKNKTPANTAGEAIEKMLQEKKISSKINYEALKILNSTVNSSSNQQENNQESSVMTNTTLGLDDKMKKTFNKPMSVYSSDNTTISLSRKSSPIKSSIQQTKKTTEIPQQEKDEETMEKEIIPMENSISVADISMESEIADEADDYLDEEMEADATEMSVGQMLGRHAKSEEDEDGYGYEDEEDY
ncbi:transcription factor IIIB 90 kDa subunit [Odontomachus brunneus]|uniref:transcription factor IIIB 90 kDa subunit n=1 Tax=Odontomachus brunneus TaxID=486640 RepID=UPI0013F268F8|nr:transcription factor IIIB 90 kDa subunit [Odontomachus brunneus]